MLTRTRTSCKAESPRIVTIGAVAASILALAGCASVQVESQSFRVNNESQIESAQVATDADFSQYRQLRASELGIYFPQSQLTTAGDISRIRQIFRTTFLAELEGYNVVNAAGPETMTVEASLIDMRNAVSDQIPNLRREVQEMARPGTIVFLMELRDSVSDRVLARAADSAQAPTFASADGIETDWNSIEEAADHWASLFRAFLDENFAH